MEVRKTNSAQEQKAKFPETFQRFVVYKLTLAINKFFDQENGIKSNYAE